MTTKIDIPSYLPYTRPMTTNLFRSLGPAYFQDISFPGMQGVSRGFNVKDFGAVGDASTDDTMSLQAAINAAEAAYGGCVILPTGTYKITSNLTITKSIALIGSSGTVPGPDSVYTTNAGAPNLLTMGVFIWQSTNNQDGIVIQQSPTNTYAIRVVMKDISLVGQITIAGVGPGGSSGDGIRVDAGSTGLNVQCFFENVSIEYFRGYGLKLVEGYFSSSFKNLNLSGNGLSGLYAIGTSQGECMFENTRCFGNGLNGASESDAAGIYFQGGGSGNTFLRTSCTSNYRVQAYFKGSGISLLDYQAESFNANNANDRSLIIDSCHPYVAQCYFAPGTGFLGKVIDLRSCTNGTFLGLHFETTVDPTGYHIYEDGSSGSNLYESTTVNGTFVKNLQAYSVYSPGTDVYFKGTSSNNDAPAGWIGEYFVSDIPVGSAVNLASGNWVDITSISLTPGVWIIDAVIRVTNGTAVSMTYMDGAISITSGNSSTGIVAGDNGYEGPPATSAYDVTGTVPGYRYKFTTNTTVYLKANVGFSSGTPKGFGRISAIRAAVRPN